MARTHVVKQGECLQSIARRYGFGDFRALYDHPANAKFKQLRPNPNVIFPGDKIEIPDKKTKTLSAATGGSHAFTAKVTQLRLRLKLIAAGGTPLANEPYRLDMGRESSGGTTDGGGLVDRPIPPGAVKAVLEVAGRRLLLRLGNLNPIRSAPDGGVSGVQARLRNLGYWVPRCDGKLDPATKIAIAAFQADTGLHVDGDLTAQTASKLEEEHGC